MVIARDAHATTSPRRGPGGIITVTFAENAGVTTMTTLMDFGSKEARDAAVATGMTDGMEQSYQLLERVLAEGSR